MLPRRDVQSVVEEEVFPKIERSLDQLEAQSRKLLQKAILQKDINGESKA